MTQRLKSIETGEEKMEVVPDHVAAVLLPVGKVNVGGVFGVKVGAIPAIYGPGKIAVSEALVNLGRERVAALIGFLVDV